MILPRPIELINASRAEFEAFARRDEMINNGDKVGVQAMNLACDILGDYFNSQYRQWQILGGTSNIESIALHGVGKWVTKPYIGKTSGKPVPQLQPYKSTGRRGQLVDDSDHHEWTVDGS